MARNLPVQRQLSPALGDVQRFLYVAVVMASCGARTVTDDENWQLIDLPIAADWERRPLRIINHKTGKSSQTL